MSKREPLTIQQQAEFVDYLVDRCTLKSGAREGDTAAESLLCLSADEVADLRLLGRRLHRMAPHEDAIRDVVVSQ